MPIPPVAVVHLLLRNFIMKNLCFIFFACITMSIFGQSIIINDPIINTYTAVSSIDYCTNSMSLSNNDEYNFSIGDKVLIIQMQGAILNDSSSNNNGKVIDLQSAGNYELNFVKSINLGAINGLQFEYTLNNTYDVTGKVQIIKIPQYTDVEIQSTLTCLPWDGNIGGILIFEASGEVDLQANIFVDELGFRGGAYSNDNTCFSSTGGFQGYSCNSSDNCGALKAEGSGLLYDTQQQGRGRNGSGGGGGNDHNAGGGGGGNGGNGGNGGANDLNTQFCDGAGGLGGENNFYNTSNKHFLGGGGGAGDSNNSSGTAGGNAGGIVFIIANSITANNFKISANGQDALTSVADGAGGGGAGGSIFLSIDNFNDQLLIEAKGGAGGNISDPDNCPGVGGGGAGGILWIKQNSTPNNITFNASGGNKGIYTSPTCSGLDLGAENGEDGSLLYNLSLPLSKKEFIATKLKVGTDTLICAGDATNIFANITSSANPNFEWIYNNTNFSYNTDTIFSPTNKGINKFIATASWEVFNQSCLVEESVYISVRNPDITLISSPSTPVDVGDHVFLNAIYNPANPEYTYEWEQKYVTPNDERNAVVEPFETTNFCITVTDELNCQKTACIEVQVNVPPSGAPNAFTPNNDGVNDVFKIIPEPQLQQTSFKIYNRWGELLYESYELFEWDGKVNNINQATDYYTWTAEFKHKNTGETISQSGSFNLIR